MGGVGDGIEAIMKLSLFLLIVIFLLISLFFISWNYLAGLIVGGLISAIVTACWLISKLE